MRTVRVVAATAVLVVAAHPFAHGSRRVAEAETVIADKGHAVAARSEAELVRNGLASLQRVHREHVMHALTAIDEFRSTSTSSTPKRPVPAEGLVPSELIPVDDALWERLHNCEQPDTWYAAGTSPESESGVVFEGGLGMSVGAWQMAVRAAAGRGVSLPRSALGASVYQQKVGAQAFHDAYGWGWGCRV